MSISVLARYQLVHNQAARSAGFITTEELRRLGVPQTTVSRWCTAAIIGKQLTAATERRMFTYDDIAIRLAEITRPGKRGLHRVRAVLATRLTDDERPMNGYEKNASQVFSRAGFATPVSQMRIPAGQQTYFVDFAWPDHKLIVECDSMLAHSSPEQLQSDLERQNNIVALGWSLVRFTYWDVVDRPSKVVETLDRHLPRG